MRAGVGKTVFPGTPEYDNRARTFQVGERQARERALQEAQRQGRDHVVSQRPTALYERQYVFSEPAAQGAELRGYHVDGDSGVVRYYEKSKVVKPR